MNTQREQLIHTWLTSVLENDQFQIAYLAGDESFRRYSRIQLKNKTYMLMDPPPEKEACVLF
ncbi:phosphotransferase, partial [Escherichia coli]